MDAPQAVLHWDRGTLQVECERAAIVQAGVEAYLGRPVFGAAGELIVRVRLAGVEDKGRTRVVATVTQETSDGRAWGERVVSGESDCASLDEPLTLVVALMVDAPASAPEPTPSAPLSPPARPERARSSPEGEPSELVDAGEIETAPSLEKALTARGHLVFLAFGLLSMGVLPSTGGGAGALASFKPRGFWGLGLEAGALLPQRAPLGTGSLETSLFLLSGSLCPLQGVANATWWSACGRLGMGRLHARSRDVLGAKTRSDWFALPGASVRGGWLPGRQLLVSVGLEALFPVSPDRYVYRTSDGMKEVALEPSPLMIAAELGVGLLFD